MRIGLTVPQFGHFADPQATARVAAEAESIGFDALWASDRTLWPLDPSEPYPSGDGSLPEEFAVFLDPIVTLTVAAGATSRVRLGTSTLNALWQPPVMLARSLASLDHVSNGRLDVGIGMGWSSDEYRAAGVPWTGKSARMEETLDLLEALWGPDPVGHQGPLWQVPPSRVGLKPVQVPRPPILLGGVGAAALERTGRRADGWLGLNLPLPMLTRSWDAVRAAALKADRDPDALRFTLRVNIELAESEGDPGRGLPTGTFGQYTDYIRAAVDAGVQEVALELQQSATGVAELLDLAGRFHEVLRAG
ncbi:TIGR03619 family F420-dependent LLM class oxidoreductase [Nocardiopsis sediminis]|uniref:TIGR03619 family F420-dependent LLM class oxidoreductase n=1 Tax=Nocardiopsis sediminis TaxID=1778267 RepID=A0ABV8FNH3_9ACTN